MRTFRSLLTSAPALAVLAAAMAVGAAPAPAQASVASAHHVGVAAGSRSASASVSASGAGALRHTTIMPPNAHPAGTKPDGTGPVAYGQESTNWSGYAASGGTYTSVTSSWVQPAETCTSDGIAAFWVGLDGDLTGDNAVEQIGTSADCTSGSPVYYDWYELYPAGPVIYGDTVDPGDNLTATATYTGGGYYDLELVDITHPWTENHSYYDPGRANSSAEIITEAPATPLPDFGSVGFSGSYIDGASLSAVGAQSITMIDLNGPVQDEVSSHTSTGNFMITYGTGANVTGSPIVAFQANTTGLWSSSGGNASFLGQNLAAGTSPSIAQLPGGGFEGAFQNSNGLLEVFGTDLAFNTQLGMMPGSSPSIAVNSGGTYEVAFQANTGALYVFTAASGGVNLSYGMMAGTSPSIAALPNGTFETAFQANSGILWIVNGTTNFDSQAGMMAGTSPSIAANTTGGYEVVWQANSGILWDYTPATGGVDRSYGMKAGTSPSIAALTNGTFETAFQANSGILWMVTNTTNFDSQAGMMAGTSPSIIGLSADQFEIVWQANSGILWDYTPSTGGVDWYSGMRTGTSPAI